MDVQRVQGDSGGPRGGPHRGCQIGQNSDRRGGHGGRGNRNGRRGGTDSRSGGGSSKRLIIALLQLPGPR